MSWIAVCVTFLWLSLEHNSFVKLLISGMGRWDSDCQSVAVWFACWLYKFSRMSIVCLWHYIYVGVSINMHSMWSDWLIFWSHGNATSEPPVCGRGCCWWHRCFLALCNGSDNAPDPNPDSVLQISFPNLHFVCSEILFAIIGWPTPHHLQGSQQWSKALWVTGSATGRDLADASETERMNSEWDWKNLCGPMQIQASLSQDCSLPWACSFPWPKAHKVYHS